MDNNVLWHQSGVNKKNEPFVQLIHNGQVLCQMSPNEARDHAISILESAEAAETDAFLIQFVTKKIGIGATESVAMMAAFREFRQSQGKRTGPSTPDQFIVPESKR